MKRLFSGCLALILVLLCGCSALVPEQTVICGELTIVLPADFMDLSDRDYGQDLVMVFGRNDVVISASKESAPELKAQIPDLDAWEYARLVVQTNELSVQPEERDGIPTFTYTMGTGEEAFTYLAAVFASEKNFWLVQCFCPADRFDANQNRMWSYLRSVKVR